MNVAVAILVSLISPADLAGTWNYDGYSFRGDRYPSPNPDLHLSFTFRENGRVRLFWSRTTEPGFCEREAQYSVDDNRLYQKIDWVNPDNLPECQNDTDMQLGRESVTRIGLAGNELHFLMNLDDEEFIYILKRAPDLKSHSKEKP